jgi:hypothetical protein
VRCPLARIAIAAAALSGCVSRQLLDAGTYAPDSQTVAFAISSGSGWTLYAFSATVTADLRQVRFVAAPETTIYRLEYRAPRVALGFLPGLNRVATAGEHSRPIPTPDRAASNKPYEGSGWTTVQVDRATAALVDLSLPILDLAACAAAGGCVDSPAALLCQVPCTGESPALPMPVNAAAPPNLGPCIGAGWTSRVVDQTLGIMGCEPPVPPDDVTCAQPNEALFYGASACVAVGPPCPSGPWSTDLPSQGPIVWVMAGANPQGAAGTPSAPFPTIAEGLAHLPANGILALSKGTYAETVELPDRATLWGACTGETTIDARAFGSAVHTSDRAGIRNLTLLGGSAFGIAADRPQASITVTDVIIRKAGQAIFVTGGARGSVEDVLIDNPGGYGVVATYGSRLDLTDRVSIDGTAPAAVMVWSAALTMHGVVIAHTVDLPGRAAAGLSFVHGATVAADHLRISDTSGFGIFIDGSTTSVSLSDVVVRRTHVSSAGAGGLAISVQAGAKLDAAVIVLSNNAVGANIRDSAASFRDLVLEDSGYGGITSLSSTVTIERGLLRRLPFFGFVQTRTSSSAGSAVSMLSDVLVADVTDPLGLGTALSIDIESGTRMSVVRVAVHHATARGVTVWSGDGFSSTLSGVDLTIQGVHLGADRSFGQGLNVFGSSIALSRVQIEDTAGGGVFIGQSSATLVDLATAHTATRGPVETDLGSAALGAASSNIRLRRFSSDAAANYALSMGDLSTTLDAQDLTITRSQNGGVWLGLLGSGRITRAAFADNLRYGFRSDPTTDHTIPVPTIVLEDITIRGTMPRPGITDPVREGAGMIAAHVQDVSVDRFLVEGNAGAGLVCESEPAVDLMNGMFKDQATAIYLANPRLDVRRLFVNVAFDGDTNILIVGE